MTESQRDGTGNAFSPGGSSDRSFGVVFAIFFLVVALLPLWSREAARTWALVASGAFLAGALVAPRALRPLNRAWMLLGGALHRIASPVALAILFYGVVTPTALVMRLAGKDPLRLRRDPQARSYWIARTPPGPPPESLKDQF